MTETDWLAEFCADLNPDREPPTEADLLRLFEFERDELIADRRDGPVAKAFAEASRRLRELYDPGDDESEPCIVPPQFTNTPAMTVQARRWRYPEPGEDAPIGVITEGPNAGRAVVVLDDPPPKLEPTGRLLAYTGSRAGSRMRTLAEVNADALNADALHPLTSIVRCWWTHGLPEPVPTVKGQDRILPSVREAPEREAGRLLAAIGRGEVEPPKQASLFTLDHDPKALIRRVPLLSLVDATGAPIMAQGRGASLGFRVPLHALISMDETTRRAGGGLLVLTVRELRDALFGGSWARRRSNTRPDDWQRTRAALFAADAARIPLPDGGTARLFALWREPGDRPGLDAKIVLEVRIPTEASAGAMVDAEVVNRLGRDSAPKLRAYIGVQSVAWNVGVTRVPHPKTGRFGWTGDPEKYPVLTPQDRRDFAFGIGDTKPRTAAKRDDPFKTAPGIVVIDRDAVDRSRGVRGWRIVPAAAADAIERRRERLERAKTPSAKAKKRRGGNR